MKLLWSELTQDQKNGIAVKVECLCIEAAASSVVEAVRCSDKEAAMLAVSEFKRLVKRAFR